MKQEEYLNLLNLIEINFQYEDISTLYSLSRTMELRDFDSTSQLYKVIWLSLKRSWNIKDYNLEKIVFETWNYIRNYSETLTSESIEEISSSIPKDFCQNLIKCFERKESENNAESLLTWIYVYCPRFRVKIRAIIGIQLLKCVNTPESLRIINIRPLLQLMSKIISGMLTEDSTNNSTSSTFGTLQWNLVEKILLPLHSPNLMVEWRDQIPVVQSYHESLVLCLIRTIEWDINSRNNQKVTYSNNHNSQTIIEFVFMELITTIWPEGFNSNTPKEVLLIHEIEKLIEMLTNDEFDRLFQPFLNRLIMLLSHENIRPLQRTLQLFRNEKFLNHLIRHSNKCYEKILVVLYRKGHLFWNQTVNKMTANVLKKLYELDANAFTLACQKIIQQDSKPRTKSKIQLKLFENESDSSTILQKRPPPNTTLDNSSNDHINQLPSRPMLPPVTKSTNSSKFSPMTTLPSSIPSTSQWKKQGISNDSNGNPPVTITGVAPWAFQPTNQQSSTTTTTTTNKNRLPKNITGPNRLPNNESQYKTSIFQHQHEQHEQSEQEKEIKQEDIISEEKEKEEKEEEENNDENTKEEVMDESLQKILEYIEKCRINGQGGLPDDDGQGSSWAKEQAALKPTLLPELKFHDLVFGQTLGEGSFGTVKYCRRILKGGNLSKSSWPEYAVKILSTEKMVTLGRNCLEIACREIASLHEMSHPGIARLISAFRYRDGNYLVLEYASKGDLHSYIVKNGSVDDTCARFIIGEVSSALLHIHEFGLSFNDLKPENLLITELGHIKITDFGACRAITPEGIKLLSHGNDLIKNLRNGDWRERRENELEVYPELPFVLSDENENESNLVEAEGTPGYLPPEILLSGNSPNWSVDYWSLGCVLYFCLYGRPKYYGSTFEQVIYQMSSDYVELSTQLNLSNKEVHFQTDQSNNTDQISTDAQNLIEALMKYDPNQRITIDQVLHHPYITDHDTIDPLVLYSQPAVPLPEKSSENNGGSTSEQDKEWARRQCSIVWAPMPNNYNFSNQLTNQNKRYDGNDFMNGPIFESQVEFNSSFLPSTIGTS